MLKHCFSFLLSILLFARVASAAPVAGSFTVSSSSQGVAIFSLGTGGYINSNGAICIARLDDCTQLTGCWGIPLAADTAVYLDWRTDKEGQYCGILKSGSTPVTGGYNLW